MYRHENNKRVLLTINIKNEDSLVKIIKEFIAHLTSPPNPFNLGGSKNWLLEVFCSLSLPFPHLLKIEPNTIN
jgi:hypothetical protein